MFPVAARPTVVTKSWTYQSAGLFDYDGIVSGTVRNDGRTGEVLDRLGECLAGHFDVEHCTFQIEPEGHRAHESSHHA